MREITPLPRGSRSLAPTGLTVQDHHRIQEALDSSTSANTRRAYNQAWRRFEAWANDRGLGHPLPATPELVAAFLAELAEEGKSVATLRLTKSALAKVHRSSGHPDPTDNEGVRKVMAGIARVNGRPQRQAKPLTETALAAVKATAMQPRRHRGRAVRGENAWAARRRGQAGRRPAVRATGRPPPAIGGRGIAVGRRGDPGGRLGAPPRPEIEDGSGGRGRGPVHRAGGCRGPGGHHARRCRRGGSGNAGV